MFCNGLFYLTNMTFREAIQFTVSSLSGIYDEREAYNIAELILEHLTGLKRIDRIIQRQQELEADAETTLRQYIRELRLHTPVQYLLQEAWFYGMKLYVDKHVLIPRPETEELVAWLTEDLKQAAQPLKVLDIGTGSGCIAIAVKKAIPAADVYALDISQEALAVAKKNALEQNTAIAFSRLNILDTNSFAELPVFDIIISNPPYIPVQEHLLMRENVKSQEPHLALFVPDDDPLVFYKAIARLAKQHLNASGTLYLEMHEDLADQTQLLFRDSGYKQVTTRNDMQHKTRMLRVSA